MKSQLALASLLAAPAIAGFIVPRYAPGGLYTRDIYLDEDYSGALLARSPYYDDYDAVEVYARRTGAGTGGGGGARNNGAQNQGGKQQGGGKNLSPQNSVDSNASFKTATSQPDRPPPNKDNHVVHIPPNKSGGAPPQNQGGGNPAMNAVKQSANFVKNNANTIVGGTSVLGNTLATAGTITGNKDLQIAGGATNTAAAAGSLGLGIAKDQQGKKDQRNGKRNLDDTLDVLYYRRSLGLDYGAADNMLMARALGIGMALEDRAVEENVFEIEAY